MRRSAGYRNEKWQNRAIGFLAAVAVFLAGSLAEWVIARSADDVVAATVSDLRADLFYKPVPQFAKKVIVPSSTSLDGVELPAWDSAAYAWAEANGGGAADGVLFAMMLYGTVDHPVIIESIRGLADCRVPDTSPIMVESQGAGPFDGKLLDIDLDAPGAPGVPGLAETAESATKWQFPLQVSKGEAERIDVVAHSKRDCQFGVEVTYRSGTSSEVLTFYNEGRPFVIKSSDVAARTSQWVFIEDQPSTMRIES